VLIWSAGAARGGGTENTLDARRRAAPGATLREAIATGIGGRRDTPEFVGLMFFVQQGSDWYR
jgi:hypothetical protein